MALEAVVFAQDFFSYAFKELCTSQARGGAWSHDFGGLIEDEKKVVLKCESAGEADGSWNPSCSLAQSLQWNVNSSLSKAEEESIEAAGPRKRRRSKSVKNREEAESQRMTHIAVERNRRRQMNEYLAVLRSLMPSSYVRKGDQASVVAGAINYVKELEQLLQTQKVEKQLRQQTDASTGVASAFADFFSFPQYSSYLPNGSRSSNSSSNGNDDISKIENQAATANIEVTMVESHANLKVLSRRRPKQLLKLVAGLQNLRLVPLHLNVTSVDEMAMYSFSLKVEDDCQYASVDEIAAAVHQMLGMIQEEANL